MGPLQTTMPLPRQQTIVLGKITVVEMLLSEKAGLGVLLFKECFCDEPTIRPTAGRILEARITQIKEQAILDRSRASLRRSNMEIASALF